jgi:hypothetical protein
MAPSCALDPGGMRLQYQRYRRVGAGARIVERTPRRLVAEIDDHVDPMLVEQVLAVERKCCPFFELGWERQARRLSVSVPAAEQIPALDGIAFALGLDDNRSAGAAAADDAS